MENTATTVDASEPHAAEQVYHVTVLSNFARAYDKYGRCFDKGLIPESTFPDQFFVLRLSELQIGIEKASRLLDKVALPGNRLLILRAHVSTSRLLPNLRTGKGRYLTTLRLPVEGLFLLNAAGDLEPIIPEEAYAASLAIIAPQLLPHTALAPRTLSVLPIARACQASCKFCFSASSVSLEQVPHQLNLVHVEELCARAKLAGAQRFVITGGGEPGLIKHTQMLDLIRLGHRYFDKVVLITNGYHLAKLEPEQRAQRLGEYAAAGLSVLSISHHARDATRNLAIMGLDTGTERILASFRQHRSRLDSIRLRLICVLQTGGVQDAASLEQFVDWASEQGVHELCFKELYVSTTTESVYHANAANQWSLAHQVPLSLITRFFAERDFAVTTRLPWGAPIFEGAWRGSRLAVAAYTEPSLFWERSEGLARSWNIMADGRCLVSLEDPNSALPETEWRRSIPIGVAA